MTRTRIRTRSTWLTVALVVVAVVSVLLVVGREEGPGGDAGEVARPAPVPDAEPGPMLQGRVPETGAGAGEGSARGEAWVVRGTVLRDFTSPAAGVSLHATAYRGFEAEGDPVLSATLETDAEGRFAWPLTAPEEPLLLVVEIAAPGALHRRSTHRALPGTEPPQSWVLYLLEQGCRVTGRVTDEAGSPLPAGRVYRLSGGPPTPCDEDGFYEIDVHRGGGGDVGLSASAPGYAFARARADVPEAGDGATLDFRLCKEFVVFGRVTDPEGFGIEGAVVKSYSTLYFNEATTGEGGRYRLGGLDPGRSKDGIFARHPSFTEALAWVETKGDRVELNLQLGHGVRVAGQVVDGEGSTLPGTELFIGFSASAYNRLNALAEAEGRFEFPVVPPGGHTLVAERVGYAPHIGGVQVPEAPNGLDELRIVMTAGRTLEGRVTDRAGEPVPAASLTMRYRTVHVGQRVLTDANGRFRLPDAPRDDVELSVYHTAYVRLKQVVAAGPGEDLVLVLDRAAGLAGRVVDGETGRPIASFRVRFVAPELVEGEQRGWGYSAAWMGEGRRFADADGTWSTAGARLQAGTVYGVEVQADGYTAFTDRHVVAASEPDPDAFVIRLFPGAVLTGLVRAPGTKAPVEDVVIQLFDEKRPLRPYDPDDVHGRLTGRTDARGAFRIADVPPGAVRLVALHPDHPPLIHGPVDVSGRAVDLGELAFDRGATIRGAVADAHGQPGGGATVEARPFGYARGDPQLSGRDWKTTTDAEGRFELRALPPATYRVMHVIPGRYGHSVPLYAVEVEVEGGETKEVRLVPDGSATLRGRVVTEGDLPSRMRAVLRSGRDAQGRRVALPERSVLVEDGAFTFPRVRPGTYVLECRWEAQVLGALRPRASTWQDVVLEDGESRDLEVRVGP